MCMHGAVFRVAQYMVLLMIFSRDMQIEMGKRTAIVQTKVWYIYTPGPQTTTYILLSHITEGIIMHRIHFCILKLTKCTLNSNFSSTVLHISTQHHSIGTVTGVTSWIHSTQQTEMTASSISSITVVGASYDNGKKRNSLYYT